MCPIQKKITIEFISDTMTRIQQKTSPKAVVKAKKELSKERRLANQASAKKSRENKSEAFQNLLKYFYALKVENQTLLREFRRNGVEIKEPPSVEHRIEETVRKLRPLMAPTSSFASGELERMVFDVLMVPELRGITFSSETAKSDIYSRTFDRESFEIVLVLQSAVPLRRDEDLNTKYSFH